MAETHSIDLLAHGLLNQFTSLQNLEVQLTELLSKQKEMLEKGFHELEVSIDPSDAEIAEVSLMVRSHSRAFSSLAHPSQLQMKKMNLYRVKLKTLRSDMLYIFQRITELKRKSLELQSLKADEKAEKVKRYDFEEGLIAKSKK